MRPAPRIEPAADEHAPAADEVLPSRAVRSGAHKSRGRFVAGVVVLVVALVGVGIGSWALMSNDSSMPRGSGSPATTPARPRLFFRIGEVTTDRTGKKAVGVAGDASVEIAGQLSSFYDSVFMDPDTWKNGVPEGAWVLFDRSLRARAREDSASFTLGSQAASLKNLRVENASMSVEVLVDPRGNPQAAVAEVEFKARGFLVNGQRVTITNTASFLFQPEKGEWLVFGYPSAKTTIEAQAPSPSASGASGSPDSGATSP